MSRTTGARAFFELLVQSGVRYLFGNPGTTELPLMDALVDEPRLKYVLGLQEVPVMAMADGLAMASRGLGVVNLHVSCGLGNAMGMLYNAHREGTPLLVTAGQSDRRILFEEPILAGDMVGVTRPWTKWSVEVNRVQDLPAAVCRAVQTALTPPTGPVFMSLPMDMQMEEAELDLTPPARLDRRVRPPREALARAARLLAEAKNPCILAGSRVVEADAVGAVTALAELLGAPVYSENATSHGRLPMPCDHPLYGQQIPLWSPDIRKLLAEYDAALVVGMDLLRMYVFHDPPQAVPPTCRLVHLDENPWQIGKNYPVEVGLIGDTRAGSEELRDLLTATMTDAQKSTARKRGDRHATKHAAERAELVAEAARQCSQRPLTALAFMDTVGRVLPSNSAVIEEAVTTTEHRFERLGHLKNADGYFAHRGWALGWGLGCALGVKLAWPDRPTLALLGEGAATYGIQGLWTAAKYRIPVTFIICNNGQYQILKDGSRMLGLPNAAAGKHLGMDLSGPTIDFVALAQAYGVESVRLSEPDELADAMRESLAGDKPKLIDVPLAATRASQFG